ncbi:IscS subfamily cysteine desulfurase [Mesosutterella sp. OilRF-GAM-744-9]|uniref:Cysteine desulfurase IscS n=1 Tax=Mesosutterella porci TaxID=2915351 RepID=A0ABS9MSZ6_9BURK|nr:IscS subfamily cysteine desulfurase [Mesosutterella sp. oilRF-744-WT-GAM-9]MCG5031734.1 IscS subfamily cysteine desulfurase [Mesosutterella sp. oilRF-744-WT-GAM-9]
MLKLPVYLDYSATTPVDPRVLKKMLPYFTEKFGNPASRSHAYGWEAEKAVEAARKQVADLIGADPREIVWTSGATEADNLAIKGVAHFHKDKGRHLITQKTEHKAVLDSMRQLESEGYEVTYLDVDEGGLVDVKELEAAIRPDTTLVSIMAVNNEIGTIQPIFEIGEICRRHGVLFHVDATQAIGKIHFNMAEQPIDLLSMSGHKVYGPKGIGALYVRRKPRVRIECQMHGGGHERGMRSGTLATQQIVGMGEAYQIMGEEMDEENARIEKLRDRLWAGIQKNIPCVVLNGTMEHRVGFNLNVSFEYIEGESLMMACKNLAVSSGSACTSASLEPSYVLKALGRPDELAHSSIRFTLGRYTTEEEIDFAIKELTEAVKKLRDLSPLWEMHLKGVDTAKVQWSKM